MMLRGLAVQLSRQLGDVHRDGLGEG
jgi:hypothetical protein